MSLNPSPNFVDPNAHVYNGAADTPTPTPQGDDWISILGRANVNGQLDGLLAQFAPLKNLYSQPIVQAGINLIKNLFSK